MAGKIGQTSNGLYFRNLGFLEGKKSQPKFYLGRNEEIAKTRNNLLELVWEGTKRFWMEHVPDNYGPFFDDDTLEIARAVARGEQVAYIETSFPDDIETSSDYLDSLRSHMPIRVEYRGKWPATTGEPRKGANLQCTQSFHSAMQEFRKDILESKRLERETATTKSREVEFILAHCDDLDLRAFDMQAIEGILDKLRLRPKGQRGKQISSKYAGNVIKQFRAFIRWLHKSPNWYWKRPEGYEVEPIRIPKLPSDTKVSAMTVPVYDVDELVVLWRYALPFDRLLICLGLNCAFGRREMATLTLDEIHLSQRHPYASILHLQACDDDSWIMRQRTKTSIYGEWKLWSITIQAIQWWLKHRPKCQAKELIVSAKALPLTTTRGGHGNQQLASKWNALLRRVMKDEPNFRKLSINKLRKTSAKLIQFVSRDGEVASIHTCHGSYTGDDLLKLYANRPFFKLHSALVDLEAHLKPVWESVAEPFPNNVSKPKGGPNISRGKINRIQKMAHQGYKHSVIAENLGVSKMTVSRWAKRTEPNDQ